MLFRATYLSINNNTLFMEHQFPKSYRQKKKRRSENRKSTNGFAMLSLNPYFSLHEPNYRHQSRACGIEFATIKREETVQSWFQAIFSPLYSVRLNKLFAFMLTECTMHLMSCNFICRCFCSHVMPIICFHFKCNFRLFPQCALCRSSALLWRKFYRW